MSFLFRNPAIQKLEAAATANMLSHAYLLFGPRFVGKRTFATRLAHILEHDNPEASAPLHDYLSVTADAGVEAARAVTLFLHSRPAYAKRRTVLFQNIDTATQITADAMLKTIEEPYRDTLILLTATDPEHVPETIRSRVHAVYFPPVSSEDITLWLAHIAHNTNLTAPALATTTAVSQAQGLPGLAWRLLYDRDFMSRLTTAREYIAANPTSVSTFIKAMLEEDEEFSLPLFLDFVMIALSLEGAAKLVNNSALLKKTAALARDARMYNLNPKLQLIALKQ